MKKIKSLFIFIFLMLFSLVACSKADSKIVILNGESIVMRVGSVAKLEYSCSDDLKDYITIKSDNTDIVEIDEDLNIRAIKPGEANISLSAKKYEAKLLVKVLANSYDKELRLYSSATVARVNETITLSYKYLANGVEAPIPANPTLTIISGKEIASINDNKITGLKAGRVKVVATLNEAISNELELEFIEGANLNKIEIRSSKYYLLEGETADIKVMSYPSGNYNIKLIADNDVLSLDGNTIRANKTGQGFVYASYNNITSNVLDIMVVENGPEPNKLDISISKSNLGALEEATLSFYTHSDYARKNIQYKIISGSENAEIIGSTVIAKNNKSFQIQGNIGNTKSNILIINANEIHEDPYVNVSQKDFYRNYEPAKSYMDSYYRTKHSLMSGSISEQDQAPTISSYRPEVNSRFIKNSEELYEDNGNTYLVVNAYGEVVNRIYKGGAYVTLEEVAAYVYAFGDAPVNQTESKNTKPSKSKWGKYLRLNNTFFSGDTARYPYEPELPDISGVNNGGTRYYEMDLGTTGTDCDPKYPAKPYNNGSSIVRGAARIVYTKEYTNGRPITNKEDKHVFYTYNHYNDFQEYLNYEGGWGEMFGNISGGGSISSHTDYNPTDYPAVVLRKINSSLLAVGL